MKELGELLQAFNQLADANDWHPKHSPKNLAMAVSVEAAELMEVFQWLNEDEVKQLSVNQKQQASEEMADVFLYLLCLADKLDVDLIQVARDKMKKNRQRFS